MPDREREVARADVLAAYDESLAQLERLGAEIVDVALPYPFASVLQLSGRIMSAEGFAINRALIEDGSLPLDEDVRPRLLAGRTITAQAYLDALEEREAMKAEMAAALEGIDALLTPTTAVPAIPLDEVDQTASPAHFTRPANFFDLCALSLPNGFSAEGLPISLQIIARGYDEATALRVGWAYQDATDWHLRRPPE